MRLVLQNNIRKLLTLSFAICLPFAIGCTGTEVEGTVASGGAESGSSARTDTGGSSARSETAGSSSRTDTGGGAAAAAEIAKVEVQVDEPNDSNKVTLGAGASAVTDGVATVAVRVRMLPPWHIYATKDKPTGVGIPTKLELKLPEGVTAVGDWKLPEAKPYEEDMFIYAEDVTFLHQVKIADSVTGPVEVGLKVNYQACSDQSCLAPTSKTVMTAVSK